MKFQLGYKREDIFQTAAGRKKGKNEYQFQARWRPGEPALHMVRLNVVGGYRDAKDQEGNDKDLDYRFARPKLRVDHHLSKTARVYHSGQYFKKDYKTDGQFDHEGFEVIQGWKITPRKTKEDRAYFNILAFYKDIDYKNDNQLDFKRGGLSVKGTFQKKKAWKTYTGLGYDRRDQKDNSQDRNNYSLQGGAETRLLNDLLRLSLDFEYTKWDFINRGSKDLYRVKAGVSYKL